MTMLADDVIDQYERLADGRITGVRKDGSQIWLSPAAEKDGSVILRDGRSFVLGTPRNGAASSDASEPSTLEWVRRVRDASSARAALAGVLLCFSAGVGIIPPPSPSPSPIAAAPAFERASLTTGEQLTRQQLRVDADGLELKELEVRMRKDGLVVDGETYAQKVNAYRASLRADVETTLTYADRMYAAQVEEKVLAYKASLDAELRDTASRIEKYQLRIRRDEEGLREIRRIVAERGTSATAVQLGVFPTGEADSRSRLGRGTEFSFIP